jgi:hypothetical protein
MSKTTKMSISESVRLFVKSRPYLQEALESGIVNYSALARMIGRELGIRKYDTIKMSLIRLNKKFEKNRKNMEQKILSILRKSEIEMRSKIAVIITYKKLGINPITFAKSDSGYTYIVNMNMIEKIRKSEVVKIEKNLVMITIKSPEDVEETPGIIAYLLTALAAEGINIVEFVSCYTDTILILKEYDAMRAYEILSEKLDIE